MERLQSFLGIFVLIYVAYLLSSHRKRVPFKFVVSALGLQFLLAILLLGIPVLNIKAPLFFVFEAANIFVLSIINFSNEGSRFLFGSLTQTSKFGFILAVKILPTIIFFSSLSALLYYFKILPFVIRYMALVLNKSLKVSGAESLSTVANIFIGQVEAPIMIKPFLPRLTRSELFAVMVGGMATVAGGVMAAYVGFLSESIPQISGHLVVASVLSAPAALMFAKILIPETESPETLGKLPEQNLSPYENAIDAAASGAIDGLKVAAYVGALLIAFVGLVHMGNALIAYLGELIGFSSWGASITPSTLYVEGEVQLTLTLVLSWIFSPLAFFMGIPWEDIFLSSSMLGKKVVFNEFLAYLDLAEFSQSLQPRSRIILSYALCGFANFSSMAIQIGGIGNLAPNRRQDLARLGVMSIVGGTFAACVTACWASLLIS